MDAKSAKFLSSDNTYSDHTSAVVPLVSEDKKTGELFFIGTAFYISNSGLLMTAKHNLYDKKNNHFDNLGVIHSLPDNHVILRPIGQTTVTNEFDIAYLLPHVIHDKENKPVSSPSLNLTTHEPQYDEQLCTHGFPNSRIIKVNEIPEAHFNSDTFLGKCREYHKDGFGLLKNPCYQTTIKIKSGASGGPVFDKHGHVFAVCSTGYDLSDEGENISFVTPIKPSFALKFSDGAGNVFSVQELIDRKFINLK